MKGNVCLVEEAPCLYLFPQVLGSLLINKPPKKASEGKNTLQEKRQERDHEDQKDGYNTTSNPVKDWDEIVASRLAANNISLRVYSTNSQLFVEGTNKEYWRVYQPNPTRKKKKDAQVIINTWFE